MTMTPSTMTTEDLIPAPAAAAAGDYLYVSTLHPFDPEDGGFTCVQAEAGNPMSTTIEIQSREVFRRLESVLQAAGSSMERLIRVEVQLASAEEFFEFNRVWREVFPADPPARSLTVVGDEFLLPDCRITIFAVALTGDSNLTPEPIRVDSAPDPMPLEHVPHAVKAGNFIFPSMFPATDFETGVPVGRVEGFPNYGSDPEAQADYVLSNLSKVLEAGGSSCEQIVKSQFYLTDFQGFNDVDRVWGQYVGLPPTRSTMGARAFNVPKALFAVNTVALVPGDGLEKVETRKGIRWHPVDAKKVRFSPGIEVGEWLFLAGQIALPDIKVPKRVGAPEGLPHHFSDIEVQTSFIMEMLTEQLEANGSKLDEVVDARVYLVDPRREYRGFARAWRRIFADVVSPPPLTILPSTQANGDTGVLIPGPTIEIDLTAKRQ